MVTLSEKLDFRYEFLCLRLCWQTLSASLDRIVRLGETLIPEEWKSAKRVSDGHKFQLGVYFLLIEDKYGLRPPFDVVVLGDCTRVEVENAESLCLKVVSIAVSIREQRARLRDELSLRQPAQKCQLCGQRGNSGQTSA